MVHLRLNAPLQDLFGKISPMEPVAGEEPFNSSRYYFQLKWDGVRLLTFLDNNRVMLQNRKGRERTSQYPELQEIIRMIGCTEAVLDGEAVVLQRGVPSFARILERDFSSTPQKSIRLARSIPCTYCVFDLLYLQGEDLTGLPLEERLQALHSTFKQVEIPVYLNENFSEGEALFKQVKAQKLEGIVAKEKQSPYLLGRKSSYWLKIKTRQSLKVLAGGIVHEGGVVKSVLLGVHERNGGKGLYYIGKAGSGLSAATAAEINRLASPLVIETPPFVNSPPFKNVTWLEPRIELEVEFAEWTEGKMLRDPVIKTIS